MFRSMKGPVKAAHVLEAASETGASLGALPAVSGCAGGVECLFEAPDGDFLEHSRALAGAGQLEQSAEAILALYRDRFAWAVMAALLCEDSRVLCT